VDNNLIYGQDGNQMTCHRNTFINLQESPCGFGNTEEEGYQDLLRQEGEL
jgi:hypothetical protein